MILFIDFILDSVAAVGSCALRSAVWAVGRSGFCRRPLVRAQLENTCRTVVKLIPEFFSLI